MSPRPTRAATIAVLWLCTLCAIIGWFAHMLVVGGGR